MRVVKFIKSLNIEEVPAYCGDEVQYMRMTGTVQPIDHDEFADFGVTEKIHAAPVHHFSRSFSGGNCFNPNKVERVDAFIAYSQEVQELLGMPFDALKEENERLSDRCSSLENANASKASALHKIETLSFIGRLKFVLGLSI